MTTRHPNLFPNLNRKGAKTRGFSLIILCVAAPLRFFLLFITFVMMLGRSASADSFQQSLENPRTQKAALALARRALENHFQNKRVLAPPGDLPAVFKKRAGVIVTLEKRGQIRPRGCRGTLQPQYGNLGEEIIRNALAAATRDAQEKPLQASELKMCRISLTFILSIKPIQNLAQHDARRCGLIAQHGDRIGVVLPYEGKDSLTQWKWARQKAGLRDGEKAQMLEVEAVRFREP